MSKRKDMVSEERSNNSTLNMVYLIQALKNYSEKEPITLKEIARRCDFCSPYTIRNLLDALYRRTNPKNKNLDFRLIKYIKDKETGKFIEWNNDLINTGETYYYKIEFDVKKSEIKLLTDALSMFPFLNSKQTIKLIKAIEQICSIPDLSYFKKIMYEYDYKAQVDKGLRQAYSSNEFFKTIETINEAMKIGKCVRFDYCMYAANPDKTKLVFAKGVQRYFIQLFLFGRMAFIILSEKKMEG